MTEHIAIVLYPNFQLLDLAGVSTAFEIARSFSPGAYQISFLSAQGGLIPASSGLSVTSHSFSQQTCFDTVVVVGGDGHIEAMNNPEIRNFLHRQMHYAHRISSVCSGAFVLAAAGLLDQRRATTHWHYAKTLKSLFPTISVQDDALYIQDGPIWTAAGISAGIDLALALITKDLGEDIGRRTAQQMVVFYHRPGGQSQFSALLEISPSTHRFSSLMGWIRSNLTQRLTVNALADQAGMSPRNFARMFTKDIGISPAQAVERLRIEAARAHVENSTTPIEAIATITGFHDPERMRRAFLKAFGQPPQAMRRHATQHTKASTS